MNPHGIINTEQDLATIVNEIQMGRIFYSYTEFYRGHSRDTYTLTPNLARKISSPDKLIQLEKELFEEFKSKMTEAGKVDKIMLSNDKGRNEWEWVGQAQHYGLPTRFLDWTIKPEMALFFAVGDAKDDDSDGQFWAYFCPPQMFKTDGDREEFFHHHPFLLKETLFINPSFLWTDDYYKQIAEKRRSIQYGRFSITPHAASIVPLENNPEVNQYLRKFIIPKAAKPALRKHLIELDITNESVYVEEDAAINDLIAELRKKYGV